MRRRFWRAVAKFAAKRAGLVTLSSVNVGKTTIWSASLPTTTVSGATKVTYK